MVTGIEYYDEEKDVFITLHFIENGKFIKLKGWKIRVLYDERGDVFWEILNIIYKTNKCKV